MSRAVSGVFGTTVAAPPSSQSTSKTNDSGADGSSFGDALDRARAGNASEKKASNSSASPKAAAPKSGKAGGHSPSLVKRAVDQEDAAQAKIQKKADQSSGNPESDLADENANSDAQQSADDSGKGQKKSAAAPVAAVAQDPPSAVVQLQSTASAQVNPSAAGGSPKEATGSKESAKASARTTTRAQAGVAQQPRRANASTSGNNASSSDSSDPASAEADSSDSSAKPAKSQLAIQPRNAKEDAGNAHPDAPATSTPQAALALTTASAGDVAAASQAAAVGPVAPSGKTAHKDFGDPLPQAIPTPTAITSAGTAGTDDTSDVDNSQASSGSSFADANHPKIISSITGRLLPGGGSMQIRLDPPELGAMQIRVEMHNGTMTASFETSNDLATRLLSHSLGDLRSSLAAQGVNVEKLQVSQSPKQQQQSSSGDSQRDNSANPQDTASQQEQQRKEMVRRMWQKLMGGSDPVDLVA